MPTDDPTDPIPPADPAPQDPSPGTSPRSWAAPEGSEVTSHWAPPAAYGSEPPAYGFEPPAHGFEPPAAAHPEDVAEPPSRWAEPTPTWTTPLPHASGAWAPTASPSLDPPVASGSTPPPVPPFWTSALPVADGFGPGRGERRQFSRLALTSVAALALLVGAGVGAGVTTAFTHTSPSGAPSTQAATIAEHPLSLSSILAKVEPAVAFITATGPSGTAQGGLGSSGSQVSPFGGFPFGGSNSPFGGGSPGGSSGSAGETVDEGTGMIITSNGEVLTNNHVIAGATKITVALHDSTKQLRATVIGTIPTHDLALLKIQGVSNLPTVTFGNSADIKVGAQVVAIGNALALGSAPTVTTGIISAEGRTVTASVPAINLTETLHGMLQTDAPINAGNSGGPLVDSLGQVIGMNTAVASSTAGNAPAEDIGFAIPSNTLTSYLPELRRGGTESSQRALLGVEVFTLTPATRAEYGLTPTAGAVVAQVLPGTGAAAAGLQAGDVIVALDGVKVTSASGLAADITAHRAGQQVQVTYYQGSSEHTVTATLGSASGLGTP